MAMNIVLAFLSTTPSFAAFSLPKFARPCAAIAFTRFMTDLPEDTYIPEVPVDLHESEYPPSRCFYWGPPPSDDHLVPLRTDLAREVLKLLLNGMPVETKAKLCYIDGFHCVYKFKFNGKRYKIADRRFEYDFYETIEGSQRLIDMLHFKFGAVPESLQPAFGAAANNRPWRELAEKALESTKE